MRSRRVIQAIHTCVAGRRADGWRRALFVALLGLDVILPAAAAQPGAPHRYVSDHQAIIGGQPLHYRAIVEETFVTDAKGKRTASLVSTTYLRTDAADAGSRPVIFAFNGGPGSASLWLHLGIVGPQRVVMAQDSDDQEELHPPTVPPFRLAENSDSLLDVADIVLFDPPGTGYSRILPDGVESQFYSVEADSRTTADFIVDWLRRHGRGNSPRFLMGESYGSVRAAVVAKRLAGGPTASGRMEGATLNGVILLGQGMNALSGNPERMAATALPSFAATAWYHGKAGRHTTLEAHVESARRYAAGDYVRALFAGYRLPQEERRQVAKQLSAMLGLPDKVILRYDLRISPQTFANELLKPQGLQLGLYDGRYTLPARGSAADPVADDPAMGQYVPAFVGAMDDYFRRVLGVGIDRPYNAIEFAAINARWDWGAGPGIPLGRDYADDMATAMRRNPNLRLFVGTGYYDLVTTLGEAEYTLSHAGIDAARVRQANYLSGHMPYLGLENRRRLSADLRQFLRETSAPDGSRTTELSQ